MRSQYIMSNESEENKSSPNVNTGNASNPSPQDKGNEQNSNNQLLDQKAEKYIRESGNIEDMPNPEEEATMDKIAKDNEA